MTEPIRINKYLSEAGICSRREADRQIQRGIVTINGRTAGMGDKVCPGDVVMYGKKPVSMEEEVILLAVNKPPGIVCTLEKREKDNIVDFIGYPKRIYPIGRLDKSSHGLILMTNQGELANQIMRSRNCHEKEYIVTVKQEITPEFLESMAQGVYLKDLHIKTRKCRIRKLEGKMFSVVLTQGVNRQIKRMCKACGNTVSSIKRVRIMNIELGDLPENAWREIQGEEKRKLYELSGQKRTDERADR